MILLWKSSKLIGARKLSEPEDGSFSSLDGAMDAKLKRDMLFIDAWRECESCEESAVAATAKVL